MYFVSEWNGLYGLRIRMKGKKEWMDWKNRNRDKRRRICYAAGMRME